MAITIPAKYAPRFPDIEAAVIEMLQPVASQCTPPGKVVTALPPGTETLDSDEWFLIITRVGGGKDPNNRIIDRPVVAVSALSAKRSDSWDLAGMARAVFEDFEGGGNTKSFHIMDTSEQIGPVQNPFASPDRRIVTLNFVVSTRKLRKR